MAQGLREHNHFEAILYASGARADARLPARDGPGNCAPATPACRVKATLPGGLGNLAADPYYELASKCSLVAGRGIDE
jgi:hypothetical protein